MSAGVAIPKKVEKIVVHKEYTLWEYLVREERAKDKHEFYNGTIVKTPNTKFNHNLIASNVLHYLRNALHGNEKKYIVLGDGQKVYIEVENVAVYPDALVIFEQPIFYQNRQDLLLNPLLIVEVLSRKTSLYDRTAKFDLYQAIPSFKEYILINHQKVSIETRFREANDLWRITNHNAENQTVQLKSLQVNLNISDIYENVVF
jgi:Uma2 family endonuclease